jgi:predicted metal-dependent peptidase
LYKQGKINQNWRGTFSSSPVFLLEDLMADRMKELIAKYVLRNSYWGYLFSRIRRQAVPNFPSIMGVGPVPDGTICLYYEPNMIEKTSDDVILKLLEHEGMHIINKHISRFLRMRANEFRESDTENKRQAWNIAADCCVNVQCSFPPSVTINEQEWPAQFPHMWKLPDGKATEWYFHELMKAIQKMEKQMQQMEGSSGEGKDDNKGGKSKNKDGKGKGQPTTKLVCSHDKWSDIEKEVSDLSSLSRKLDQHTMNIIRESVKNFNQQRGRLPAGVEDLIKQALRPPEAPYYQIIRKYVRACRISKFKRSFTRINRKRTYVFALNKENKSIPVISPFPGKTRDFTFNVAILIDTSGSMSMEAILEALSGVKNIIENDKHCKITVIECDAQVQKEYIVKKVKDIEFKIKGRGGTTLLPGLERAKELHTDVVLGFTDGWCDDINSVPRKRLPKKMILVVPNHGDPKTINKTGPVVRVNTNG